MCSFCKDMEEAAVKDSRTARGSSMSVRGNAMSWSVNPDVSLAHSLTTEAKGAVAEGRGHAERLV